MLVLLIEPDPKSQLVWQKRLRDLGHECVVARDGSDLGQAMAGKEFAAAICSYSESLFTEDFMNMIRQKCRYTICLTGDGDSGNGSGDREEQVAMSKGFHDCLKHDCSDQRLVSKLDHAAVLDQLESRLAQAQKLESIGELAAGIAHEINTPIQYVGDNTRFVQEACTDLNEVLACCQDLLSAVENSQDVAAVTKRLQSAMDNADVDYLIDEIPSAIIQTLEGVDRVANIVRAMKEFAHPGASEMTPIELPKAVNNTVMVARNEWKYVAEVETDFDPNLGLVPCLPGELNQVLLNMIVNAAHAIAASLGDSPDSKGTITIGTRNAVTHAEIRITDTGSGIAPKNVERIFTPFFTTKAAGKGTGQGLAIAHSVIVEKHGGTIEVESELGKGTTFVIRIPLENARTESDLMSQEAIGM